MSGLITPPHGCAKIASALVCRWEHVKLVMAILDDSIVAALETLDW